MARLEKKKVQATLNSSSERLGFGITVECREDISSKTPGFEPGSSSPGSSCCRSIYRTTS